MQWHIKQQKRFFLFVLPSRSVSTELPLSTEVSKNGVCDASYQLMLWRRDQPVPFDRWVTPPAACRPLRDAAPGVRERVGSLGPVHRLRAPSPCLLIASLIQRRYLLSSVRMTWQIMISPMAENKVMDKPSCSGFFCKSRYSIIVKSEFTIYFTC